MRAVSVFSVLLLSTVLACGGGATPPPATSSNPTSTATITIAKAPDSGNVDKVGLADGALKPDGVKDHSFAVTVDGAIKAIFLVAVDDAGKSNGQFQADTLIGEQEVPKSISTKWGGGTAGIGVMENDAIINAPDGSMSLSAGAHRLVLYIASNAALKPGTMLRVFVQRPDGSVDAGGTIKHE